MKSTIPSRFSVEQGESGSDAACKAQVSGKGQNPHFDSEPADGKVAPQAAWRVTRATPGDHPLVHRFLVSVFQKPSAAEYQAQLEEPSYEPADRLLIKNGDQILSHLRILNRELHFGRLVLPVGIITDVATLPEYRRHGCASALLVAARKILLRDGAALGVLATSESRFYQRHGWFVCGRHCYSTAAPRDIRSHLTFRESERLDQHEPILKPAPHKRYNIRLWRHVELAALKRLYGQNMRNTYGALVRSDAYWRWLVGRGGNQQLYVAIDGPDKFELDDALQPIVGYAAARQGRIVELMYSPEHREAAVQLLQRACGDAIEKDFLRVRVDALPQEPLHQLLAEAGAEYRHHEADQGMVFMANIFKPRRFLKMIGSDLAHRAREAGLPRPCQLGLLIDNDKYRLSVSRRNVELIPGTLGRSYLKCSHYDINQLLMGHLDVRDATESGRLAASTGVALETAVALFPRLPVCRPPWDDLPAN